MTREESHPHLFVGQAAVRRVSRWSFPTHELGRADDPVAQLGRTGWLKIYFGRGQRIELPDGIHWWIRSVRAGGTICPMIVDEAGSRVTMAGLSNATYGITGKDYAHVLVPADRPRFGRPNRWTLRQFDDELATVTRYPLSVEASTPVHLGAVLISFVLVRFGLPEESAPSIPSFRWGSR